MVQTKTLNGYVEIMRFKNPDAINILRNLKNANIKGVSTRVNTIILSDGANQDLIVKNIKNQMNLTEYFDYV